jgi:predicted dehydrogenase
VRRRRRSLGRPPHLAREITNNPSLPASRRYQDLLARADIDCIVAAVPDHWHKRVVVDACNAGKDIYCEKPMSHTAGEGFDMVDAAHKNNRIVQIGSQRVSSGLCAKARELYQNGAIGERGMVELSLGRNEPNGAWVYPPPSDFTPQTVDWDTWLNDAPKIPIRPGPLRALALLEGVRHRRRRRPDGAPAQRDAVHARLE